MQNTSSHQSSLLNTMNPPDAAQAQAIAESGAEVAREHLVGDKDPDGIDDWDA